MGDRKMRIAILIGVSEYAELNNLPACRLDVKAIDQLLSATGLYNQKLHLTNRVEASEAKQKVLSYLEKFKGEEVDEVFFYYSGHGDFTGEELYYLMSDFTDSKRRQTSIENTEIDNLLRNLNPNLTIKILDCCYSGIAYIKNSQSLKNYFEDRRGSFKNCYFMMSSQANQQSYADDTLSDFTKSILSGISERPDGPVRYKDMIDAVTDRFEIGGKQVPQFIIQATMKEIFCNLNSTIRDKLITISTEFKTKLNYGSESLQTLEELVNRDAKSCCSREEVAEVLNQLKQNIEQYSFPKDLFTFFQRIYYF
jgi:hypothetical protein